MGRSVLVCVSRRQGLLSVPWGSETAVVPGHGAASISAAPNVYARELVPLNHGDPWKGHGPKVSLSLWT